MSPVKTVINPSTVATYLASFEEQFAKQLAPMKLGNVMAWQIVKTPLYFNIINSLASGDAPVAPTPRTKANAIFRRVKTAISVTAGFTQLWLKANITGKKDRVLLYTFSADKLAKNEQGKYYNYLVDAFVSEGLITNYIYAEASHNGDFKNPSYIKPHFNLDLLNSLVNWHLSKYRGDRQVTGLATGLSEMLNGFFHEQEVDTRIDAQLLETSLQSFLGQYHASKTLFGVVKPRLLITSEQLGSGLLAAAREMNIPSIDLQHGLIDEHHPSYTYSSQLAPFKNTMAIPAWIGVFGALHKRILLAGNFWKEEEIIVLGNARVEMSRRRYDPVSRKAGNTILFPTQWTFFKDSIKLLEELVELLPADAKILVKLHPMERPQFIEGYEELADAYPSRIEIASEEEDIYPLIYSAKLVIGFDSTVLLEAVTMGVPSITISTPSLPDGVHTLTGTTDLLDVIKPVALSNVDGLGKLVAEALSDAVFYKQWSIRAADKSDLLYANTYYDNCRKFIAQAMN